ncbi:alpha-mannosidase 2C1 isoform X1 [Lingula anatina]|uniref:alpha-mannosidase n=1 Tax=Lingula anatina TaxID=7574 RepID=A0A1S3HME7_LINAN|nr:alpha-mannosidase 2C1 isoform X1 [Lingula anatina]|eukprot:XP_013387197.1 alpha-mannosidase 2C1 isoform X1 [Lingula anatina]
MEQYVVKNKRTTLERIDKFISPIYFTDVNLRGRLYPLKTELTGIKHHKVPDCARVPYHVAVNGEYEEGKVGGSYGPTWSTHWFRLDIDIPSEWTGQEVHLIWNSASEAMVWKDGKVLQGLSGEDREYFIITKNLGKSNLRQVYYIEMACNRELGEGQGGLINPPDPKKYFTLSKAHIAVFDRDVYNLLQQFQILYDIVKHLPENSNRGYQALHTANDMINTCDVFDKSTFGNVNSIAQRFFAQKNGDSQHTIYATGHCHIDSAWLWPYAETIRKCARSWSSTVSLMDSYPQLTFACSQAQQFQWVKDNYPDLFERIKHYVKEGRFVPVGGTWVEMDGLIPSGEAFIRQFLYGQHFFQQEFGVHCEEFWLPDTFGYSAQLPQIMKSCGISRFLTQKMSWNLVNKFPHHTFWWEGLDGSQVLAHFPPGDSYGMKGKIEELLKTVNNFLDKGRCNCSMYLFGFGDGGQGPTEDMVESLLRLKDIDGLPKVKMATPGEFFQQVESAESDNLCKWVGELYLELHNGTYTTQAKTKEKNRRCEFLLQNAELSNTLALVLHKKNNVDYNYPSDELERLWKLLLLNQFHDVLPGSSIQMVYKDALKYYHDIETSGKKILVNGLQDLLTQQAKDTNDFVQTAIVFNPLCWQRKEVVVLPPNADDKLKSPARKKAKADISTITQISPPEGKVLALVDVPSMGHAVLPLAMADITPVFIEKKDDQLIYIQNEHLSAAIDPLGRVVYMAAANTEKNVFSKGLGNQIVIFDDVPLFWDAWDVMDYHLETRKCVEEGIQYAMIVEEGPLRASVEVSLKISDHSYLKQVISLDVNCPYMKFSTEVHWHENHKFLKVEFPVAMRAMQVTYELQFGHLQRSTHFNTSWDWARYEVCGHKWADISEHDWGLAILNDSKYGYSARDNVMRLSLLRSPKAPDPKADMGVHYFTYALMPHTGTFQEAGVIQQAYNLNCPLQLHHLKLPSTIDSMASYFSVDNPAVVLETVKKGEEGDDSVIIRMYEAFGSTTTATITTTLPFTEVHVCDSLECIIPRGEVDFYPLVSFDHPDIVVQFTPFKIATLMLMV